MIYASGAFASDTERPAIQLRVVENQLQIGTAATSPYYVQWRTPDGTWQTWSEGTEIPPEVSGFWLRGVFQPDDPTSWELPVNIGQILSADWAVTDVAGQQWATIAELGEDGGLTGVLQPLVVDESASWASEEIPTAARNNQASATPDPGTSKIYWKNNNDARFAVWIMTTSGVRKASSVCDATAPGGWSVVGTGDIDRDGVSDIMWFRPSDGAMAYWLMEPDGWRKSSGSMGATAPGGWTVVGTGDIDADGTVDMMWFRPTDGAMSYWLLNTNGTRKAAGGMGATAPGGWRVVGTGDIDADGTVDMMWFRPTDGAMAYWLLNTNGTRKAAGSMGATAPGGWSVVGTGDIDRNGATDLMWYRPTDSAMAYWLLETNGTRKAAGSMGATAPGGWSVVASGSTL